MIYTLLEWSTSLQQVGYSDIRVLEKGRKYAYTVPSFPVVTAMLREVKLAIGGSKNGTDE